MSFLWDLSYEQELLWADLIFHGANLEKQEMRAKKKTTGYAPVSRQRGKQKFTMDDLKEVMQKT